MRCKCPLLGVKRTPPDRSRDWVRLGILLGWVQIEQQIVTRLLDPDAGAHPGPADQGAGADFGWKVPSKP